MGMGQRMSGGMDRIRERQRRKSEDRFAERFATQFAQQWATVRAERRQDDQPTIHAGPSNFSRAQVPWAVDLAAAWSWRFLVIVAALIFFYVAAAILFYAGAFNRELAVARAASLPPPIHPGD